MLFAKDPPRLARFYAALTGMDITVEEPGVVVLESDAVQLVLHGIPARIAAKISIASPPKLRRDTAVKLVFAVPSLVKARAAAPGLGGGLLPRGKEFTARGFRACDGHDPEGNVVQFRQSAT